jgi:glyoxylase-like metal-dependent hydrolase (beta-lactamase superfamily II)
MYNPDSSEVIMSKSFPINRRHFIVGSALAACAPMANAAAPLLGPSMATHRRFQLGSFEVTTILANSVTVENDPQGIFGLNVSKEEFQAVTQANNLPTDKFKMFYTPTVVNTGKELVLFDTGQKAEGTIAALASAGYTPEQIDVVVLTHMHGDHIGGLHQADGTPTYPNARYVTGAAEYEEWDFSGNDTFETQVRPLEDQIEYLDPNGAVASGITAIEAFGHTPGHMGYMLDSDGKQLLIGGDFANHYIWSLAYPDWDLRFDRDRDMAAQTRRRLLGMLAADKMPFIGYHMPWPGIGFVETREDGFRYVPASYQFLL